MAARLRHVGVMAGQRNLGNRRATGALIRKAFDENTSITQTLVAKELGVSDGTVSKWALGTQIPGQFATDQNGKRYNRWERIEYLLHLKRGSIRDAVETYAPDPVDVLKAELADLRSELSELTVLVAELLKRGE